MITQEQITELIHHLQGSCKSLLDGIHAVCGDDHDEEELTKEQHQEIDGEIFLCDQCGWWCETSEQSEYDGDQLCNDCYADH